MSVKVPISKVQIFSCFQKEEMKGLARTILVIMKHVFHLSGTFTQPLNRLNLQNELYSICSEFPASALCMRRIRESTTYGDHLFNLITIILNSTVKEEERKRLADETNREQFVLSVSANRSDRGVGEMCLPLSKVEE